jgi:putative tryptophan/tyrosine transport system substrate-binding protein
MRESCTYGSARGALSNERPYRYRRREFITLLGGAAVAWPLAARAQQSTAKIPRIGIIDDTTLWDHFRQGLRDLGYMEGRNVGFDYRVADGKPDRLAATATELAHLPVNVIATYGTASTRAAMQATTSIPIVMIGSGDPAGAGLVASLAGRAAMSRATRF